MADKIVLAYSGGLDTSVILKWLQVERGYDVVTFTADLGQEEELDGVEAKALKTGAVKAYIEDLKEEFARDFVFPMLRGAAVYEGRYLLGTSIARPLIAKKMVEIAKKEGAVAVAHGATGKGNDQVRFELTTMALAPEIKTVAPWREWDLLSRTDLNAFAEKHNIHISSSNKRYSIDRNMLHCSFEGAELEDPYLEPEAGSYLMAKPIEQAPNEPEYISIDFVKGDAVAINGKKMSPAQIIMTLNKIAGNHGIGRIDIVESRFVGMKSRGVYETPGGTVLHAAHRDLEGICLDREEISLRDAIMNRYAAVIYNGFWFSPEREAMQALIDKTQERMTGTVRLKLYKGCVLPVGRKSPYSLYNQEIVTFEESNAYDQKDAAGFIKLNGLRIRGYGNRKV